MVCKCGFSNKKTSKYCEGCGRRINIKYKNYIYILLVILLITIFFILLSLVFNDPKRKIEKELNHFYLTYNVNKYDEGNLKEIRKIVLKNKDDKDVLNKIRDSISKEIDDWENDFNHEYKDIEELDKAYKKLSGTIEELHSYFNGMEYIISYEEYNDRYTKIYEIYKSKINYLKGIDAKDDYDKYYYFQRVSEKDIYYKKVEDYINNYVSGEINKIKENLKSFDLNKETLREKYDACLEIIKYLNDHKKVNNIDLSNSSLYKSLYNEYYKLLINNAKEYLQEIISKEELFKTKEILNSIKEYRLDENEEIDKLIEEVEDIIPISLLELKRTLLTSNAYASNFGINIDNKDYGSYIAFDFKKKDSISYSLDNKYQTLKFKMLKVASKGVLNIYADDKKIYECSEFKEDIISLDVKDVKSIKFELDSTVNSGERLYLVEPYLYK